MAPDSDEDFESAFAHLEGQSSRLTRNLSNDRELWTGKFTSLIQLFQRVEELSRITSFSCSWLRKESRLLSTKRPSADQENAEQVFSSITDSQRQISDALSARTEWIEKFHNKLVAKGESLQEIFDDLNFPEIISLQSDSSQVMW